MAQSNDDLAKALEAMSGGQEPREQLPEPPKVPPAPHPHPQPHPQPVHPEMPPSEPSAEPVPSARPAVPAGTAPSRPAALHARAKAMPARSAATILKLQQFQNQIRFKQTIIPPLLTMGVLLASLAAFCFVDEDPLVESTGLKIAMLIFGALLLAAAAFTMLQVKQTLSQKQSVDTP